MQAVLLLDVSLGVRDRGDTPTNPCEAEAAGLPGSLMQEFTVMLERTYKGSSRSSSPMQSLLRKHLEASGFKKIT
jgi:hypothetical protein